MCRGCPTLKIVEAEDGICRIYGFSDPDLDLDALSKRWRLRLVYESPRCNNVSVKVMLSVVLLIRGIRADITRGKGKACHQSRTQFDL